MTARIRTNPAPPQREESPESRRLFGAGLGRAAPTYSRRKAFQGQYDRAKEYKRRAASPVSGTPSRSPQRNAQTRSEPTKADNRTDRSRTHKWRSRPGGTGTEHIASRPVCRHAANSRCEPRQSPATETHRRTRAMAKPRDRNASPGTRDGKAPRQKREGWAIRDQPPRQSHNRQTRSSPVPDSAFRTPNSEFSPAVSPRAQTPVPELKPASINAAPADNSLAYKNHRRSAASAREMTSRGNARKNRIKRAAGAKIGGFLP